MTGMEQKVAVIDIGSNTIKLLVAARAADGAGIETLRRRTLEARMGRGISASNPFFPPEVIERGARAVAELVREARELNPATMRIVATSAARDAQNRDDFSAAVREKTGLPLEILSGEREAQLIGAAIQADPAIDARNYYVFDLGGGSLECLRFRDRKLEQEASLPLGCVRLAEKLLPDPHAPLSPDQENEIQANVTAGVVESGFTFSLPDDAIAVGTGGTLTSSLEILAAERGQKLREIALYLSRRDLRHLLNRIGALPLEDRLKIAGVSPGRADVFPTALATFLAILDLTKRDGIHHSLLNLRYGLASELLGK